MEEPEVVRCPKCGSKDTRESHSRRFLDTLLRTFRRIPWRCRQCQNRFYIHGEYSVEEESEDEPQESGAK